MFAPSHTSASRPPLLSMPVHTALSAPHRPPEVFSSLTNRTASLPSVYDRQIVRPKPIGMNTCTKKDGAGRSTALDKNVCASTQLYWNHALAEKIPTTPVKSYSFKKTGGGGALKLYLNVLSSGGRRECQHDLLATFDFDHPCFVDRGARGDGRAYAPPVCATPHELRRRCDLS
jgi:hypothetical protein